MQRVTCRNRNCSIGSVTTREFSFKICHLIPLFTKNATVAEWIFGWSKAAALDWAQALASAANAAPAPKPSVPLGCAPYGSSQRSALLQVSRYSQEGAPCAASRMSCTTVAFLVKSGISVLGS